MFAEAADLFSALGDETRLRLVARLSQDGPQSIHALTTGTAMSRQAVRKHLRVLDDAGLARSERRGREMVWAVRAERMADAQQYLAQISAEWDARVDRLRALLDEEAERPV